MGEAPPHHIRDACTENIQYLGKGTEERRRRSTLFLWRIIHINLEKHFIMSTTIVTTTELQNVLADYKIHLTGDNPSNQTSSSSSRNETRTVENPAGWPRDHRRVPDYRPIDRNRGAEERPNGSNGFERGFLTIMFTGVVLNAVG